MSNPNQDSSLRNDFGGQGQRVPPIEQPARIKKGDTFEISEKGKESRTVRVTSITPQFMTIEDIVKET